MAVLKDLIVNGASRFIGDIFGNKAQLTTLEAPTSAGGTTYGPGSNGQLLSTNGTSLYWRSLGNSIGYNVTDRTSATAIGTGTGLMTERAVYYGLPTINNAHNYTSSTTIYAPTAGGTANTQALVGNGATATPKWVNISPSISITAGTSSATPKVNVTVLGQSGTAQAITTATTGVYGATKLTDAYTSTDATLAATGKSILAAIQTLDVSAQTGAANKTLTSIAETDGKITGVTYSDIAIATSQITSGTLVNARLPARLQEYHTSASNDSTASGWYYGNSGSPFTKYHSSNADFMVWTHGYSDIWASELATDFRSNRIAVRNKNNGTWNSWNELASNNSIVNEFTWSSDIYYDAVNNRFTNTRTTNSWASQIYSKHGFSTGCYISFRVEDTTHYRMVGLNSDPTTDANYSSIDYCWYPQSGGNLNIYENGSSISSISGHTTYAAGDDFRIEYSDGYVRYYHNGVLCRSVARAISGQLYADSSLYNGGTIVDLRFGPITAIGADGRYVNVTGDTMTGTLSFNDSDAKVQRVGRSKSWHKGRDGAVVRTTSISGYSATASIKTSNGSWDIGAYASTEYTDDLLFSYVTDTLYNGSSATTTAQIKFLENSHIAARGFDLINSGGDNQTYGSLNIDTAGTTSTGGISMLNLGNDIATGTAKNAKGMIRLYASTTYKTDISTAALTASRTLTLPDATGWVAVGGNGSSTGVAGANQIMYLSTSGVLTAGTSATNANTANTIVKRDGSGNFSAGTITANLSGNATSADGIPQTETTSGSWRKVLLNGGSVYSAWNTAVSSRTSQAYQTMKVSVQPSTNTLKASNFIADADITAARMYASTGMYPTKNNQCYLGSDTYRWKSIYAATSFDLKDSSSNYTYINPGYMELSHSGAPYIDFHRANSTADYTARIITGLDGSTETLLLQSQEIVLSANGKSAALYSDGNFVNWNGHIYAGGDGANREYDICVRSKAGSIYLYSLGDTAGNRGIYGFNASGTGQNVIIVSQNGNVGLRNGNVYVTASGSSEILYGAAWNDYAEYRKTDTTIEPGRCIVENGDDSLRLSTKRLERGCEIVSDTFGFAIGQTDECQTPTAASGRVLAYIYEGREAAAAHIGWPVCSGPNGTVSIMTEEEEERYPSRIIGTISAVPDYETWNDGNVEVNGRIWIRIR